MSGRKARRKRKKGGEGRRKEGGRDRFVLGAPSFHAPSTLSLCSQDSSELTQGSSPGVTWDPGRS